MQGIQPYDSLSKSISKSVFSDTIHKGVNYVETVGRDVTEGMKRVEKQVEKVSNGIETTYKCARYIATELIERCRYQE